MGAVTPEAVAPKISGRILPSLLTNSFRNPDIFGDEMAPETARKGRKYATECRSRGLSVGNGFDRTPVRLGDR